MFCRPISSAAAGSLAIDADRIRRSDQHRVGAAEVAIGPGVVDVPRELLGGDVNLERRLRLGARRRHACLPGRKRARREQGDVTEDDGGNGQGRPQQSGPSRTRLWVAALPEADQRRDEDDQPGEEHREHVPVHVDQHGIQHRGVRGGRHWQEARRSRLLPFRAPEPHGEHASGAITMTVTAISTSAPARAPSLISAPSGVAQMGQASVTRARRRTRRRAISVTAIPRQSGTRAPARARRPGCRTHSTPPPHRRWR